MVTKVALWENSAPPIHIVFSVFTIGANSALAPGSIYEAGTSHKTSMAVKGTMVHGHEVFPAVLAVETPVRATPTKGCTDARQKPAHAPQNYFTDNMLRPCTLAEGSWTVGQGRY
ncbi:MAG: hypothetical protein AB7P52_02480 [Alphaproteobacteria bacterium]